MRTKTDCKQTQNYDHAILLSLFGISKNNKNETLILVHYALIIFHLLNSSAEFKFHINWIKGQIRFVPLTEIKNIDL
ncbi:hypothetical protein BpHYR1_034998 [Brachionus plicatilis]|uniref:Uncharacterized protein n=1 Tax=Brachionus plicatilis TaxID=10195 RepID=A0A3M7R8G9_BRAPC|nr:hypothetical protein BpHYR1_034998 [Brachionus plicatilis]